MKKILSYTFLIIFVIAISFNGIGCGRSNETAKTDIQDSNEPVTLKLIWWGNDQRKDLTQKAIEMFQQKHPNVKFETKIYPNTTDIKVNLAMNTADEEMPDIIQMDLAFIHNVIYWNLLVHISNKIF